MIVDVTTLKSWNGLDPSRHSAITFKETHEPSTNNLLERRIVVMMGKGKNEVAGKNSRENKGLRMPKNQNKALCGRGNKFKMVSNPRFLLR